MGSIADREDVEWLGSNRDSKRTSGKGQIWHPKCVSCRRRVVAWTEEGACPHCAWMPGVEIRVADPPMIPPKPKTTMSASEIGSGLATVERELRKIEAPVRTSRRPHSLPQLRGALNQLRQQVWRFEEGRTRARFIRKLEALEKEIRELFDVVERTKFDHDRALRRLGPVVGDNEPG